MEATSPTRVPRILGTLSIVFAALVLCGSLFGVLGLAVPALIARAPAPRPDDAAMVASIGRMYGVMGGLSALYAVLAAALLGLGIGQLRYRRWAAVWTVRWAIVALGAVLVTADLVATTFTQSLTGMLAAGPNGLGAGAQPMSHALGIVYAAMAICFWTPYPLLLLVFFSRKRVCAAMTA